ncbi:MAG: arsenical-resistance protein, partial [Spirochaetaceae bacterium]|nr:arsenical-resistance protein [Spirochaetaceae bacterium]
MAEKHIGFFARYLSLWVALCIGAGVAVGILLPSVPDTLSRFEYANVSIPVALLIWLMIYPMMLKVDFKSIVNAGRKPKGLMITLVINWMVKPFTMYLIARLFLKVIFKSFIPDNMASEYV